MHVVIKLALVINRSGRSGGIISAGRILDKPIQHVEIRRDRGISLHRPEVLMGIHRIPKSRFLGLGTTGICRDKAPARHFAILQSRSRNVRSINSVTRGSIRSNSIIRHRQLGLSTKGQAMIDYHRRDWISRS